MNWFFSCMLNLESYRLLSMAIAGNLLDGESSKCDVRCLDLALLRSTDLSTESLETGLRFELAVLFVGSHKWFTLEEESSRGAPTGLFGLKASLYVFTVV